MAISQRLRYEILRRDNHACRYCGATAPDVKLTVDHVVPVSLGGTDEPGNLVAACGPCNSGKSASSPDAPLVAQVAEDALRWRRAMEVASEAAQREADTRRAYEQVFLQEWNSWSWTTRDFADGQWVETEHHVELPVDWQYTVVELLSAGLAHADMVYAVDTALSSRTARNEFGYFVSIAQRKLQERQALARRLIDEGQV